jgi:hypothetical protein
MDVFYKGSHIKPMTVNVSKRNATVILVLLASFFILPANFAYADCDCYGDCASTGQHYWGQETDATTCSFQVQNNGFCGTYSDSYIGSTCMPIAPPSGTGNQTRPVVCKDSGGAIVADSFCIGAKPATSQSCVISPPSCPVTCSCVVADSSCTPLPVPAGSYTLPCPATQADCAGSCTLGVGGDMCF